MVIPSLTLLNLANFLGWDYGPDWLRVQHEHELDAILDLFSYEIAATAHNIGKDFKLKWSHMEEDTLPIPPSQIELFDSDSNIMVEQKQIIDIHGITVASLELDEILLRLFFDEFLPNPEKRLGLIRRSDYQQVAISNAIMSNVLRPGVTKADVVKRMVWDYGYWPDIEERSINLRSLTPNDPNSSVITSLRMHDTTGRNWRVSEAKMRLIEDSKGNLYSLSEVLNVKNCAIPFSEQ